MIFECHITFAIDINQWLRDCDRYVVFLSKYAGLPPDWVEEQDLIRLNRLVKETTEFMRLTTPGASEPSNRMNDTTAEWL